MEIALIIIVFTIVFLCRYYLGIQIAKGNISGKIRLILDIISLILIIALIIVFGLRFISQWRENIDITTQLVVYIIFVIGCIVHFIRVFANNRHNQLRR